MGHAPVSSQEQGLTVPSRVIDGSGHGKDVDRRGSGRDAAARRQNESAGGLFPLSDDLTAQIIDALG